MSLAGFERNSPFDSLNPFKGEYVLRPGELGFRVWLPRLSIHKIEGFDPGSE